jgi:peptidoglycan/xylan/chitin deacetylase (PgdA/CDA1 family)
MEGKTASLPPKPILLTFDDGTIENYEIVYPLLEEFGYTGVGFVITSPFFIQFSKKFWWKEVDRSGILKMESHSRTHSLIWVSPEIVDFYTGEDPGDYFLIKKLDTRLGAPIYDYDYELVNDWYQPNKRVANFCVNYVAQNGREEFFKKEGWREELWQLVENFRNDHPNKDSYESERQKEARLKKEIYQSKRTIEQSVGHGKEVTFFAYPWGAYDEDLILQLKRYGYRGAFTTDWGGNFPGDDPFKIKRIIVTTEMTVEDLANILELEW